MNALNTGDVIVELDNQGRFVELWVVTMVQLHGPSGTIRPYKVRRACRPRASIETWAGWPWRHSEHHHTFALPQTL